MSPPRLPACPAVTLPHAGEPARCTAVWHAAGHGSQKSRGKGPIRGSLLFTRPHTSRGNSLSAWVLSVLVQEGRFPVTPGCGSGLTTGTKSGFISFAPAGCRWWAGGEGDVPALDPEQPLGGEGWPVALRAHMEWRGGPPGADELSHGATDPAQPASSSLLSSTL